MKHFAFPLNIYARVIELEEGSASALHYGLFEPGMSSIAQAQERATALLWQHLPPPCRVLEVGIGLGTTLARLQGAGYTVQGVTPDAEQANAARQRHGAALPVVVSKLEDLAVPATPWDLLLLQESAQYIAPEALFDAADRLLSGDRASILLMDEFALSRDNTEPHGLHLLSEFEALALRRGWSVQQRLDLSAAARPTVDFLIQSIARQQQRLIAEWGLEPALLDDLLHALARYQRCYRAGIYGYALMHLQRHRTISTLTSGPPARVADAGNGVVTVGAERAPAMRALFAEVFGYEMTAAHWAWKYGSGGARGVGLMRGGRMVAHYGGVSRRLSYRQRPALGCQICDVMVAKSANRALVRKGPLYEVSTRFLQAQVGSGRPHLVGFGFPNARAYAVAARLGLYGQVDELVRLVWRAQAAPVSPAWTAQAIGRPGQGFDAAERPIVDRLWARMAAALPEAIVGVRDAAWLQHRYLMHPTHRYELLLVRSGWLRRVSGLLILRRHATHLELLDLVGAPSAIGTLVAVARAHAHAAAASHVEAWITRSQQLLLTHGSEADLSVTDLQIPIPSNILTPGPSVEDQRGRWFLMGGDADFT